MKLFTKKRPSGRRFNLNRRLLHACAFSLLAVTTLALGACATDDDTAGDGASNNSAAASNIDIDPKSLVDVQSETLFALDELGGQVPKLNAPVAINAQQTPTITIRGWAVDQRATREAGGVIINVDGKTDVVADYGLNRPDVASNLKNSAYANAGFRATIDAATLDKGRHTLTMRVVTSDRKGYYEQKQKYELNIQ